MLLIKSESTVIFIMTFFGLSDISNHIKQQESVTWLIT